jgi:hypothetical protein
MSEINPKLQAPGSKEGPNLKHQEQSRWDLEFAASLVFGAWGLELS